MSDDQTKTSDESQKDGGAPDQSGTPGTPEAGSRDAESGEKDYKAMYQQLLEREEGWKKQVEEAKRIKQEREEVVAQPPAAPDDYQQRMQKLVDLSQRAAESGDPAAALILEERAERLRLEREIVLRDQLSELPADQRKETYQYFSKNAHRLGDIRAARAELDAPGLKSEVERLRKELEQLKKAPDPEVVHNAAPTHGRETTARGNKVVNMTEDQFDAEYTRIAQTQGSVAARQFAGRLNGPNPTIRLGRG
jgi:hypothetical protein